MREGVWLAMVAAGWLAFPATVARAQAPEASMPPAAAVPPAAPAAPAGAELQSSWLKGRFLVGASVGLTPTIDPALGATWRVSPFIRSRPKPGLRPAFGLSWYRGDLNVPIDGVSTRIGSVRVRPLMVGLGYGILRGRALTSFSLVGGWAFTRARVDAPLPAEVTATLHMKNAWVVRPNITLTAAATRRLAIVGSAGYVVSRPSIEITAFRGGETVFVRSTRWRADYFSLSVGAAVSIF